MILILVIEHAHWHSKGSEKSCSKNMHLQTLHPSSSLNTSEHGIVAPLAWLTSQGTSILRTPVKMLPSTRRPLTRPTHTTTGLNVSVWQRQGYPVHMCCCAATVFWCKFLSGGTFFFLWLMKRFIFVCSLGIVLIF